MCSRNGGLFIKVGQHIGALEYLLPREYVQTFKIFHSEAPKTPLKRLIGVIEEELERPGECVEGYRSWPGVTVRHCVFL